VAALNAREARRRSRALRVEAAQLCAEARLHAHRNRRRRHACLLEAARLSALCAAPRPSPWSDLEWEPAEACDACLDQVLVPL
jgi:hypothetical protein